jgi:hypothetical protein
MDEPYLPIKTTPYIAHCQHNNLGISSGEKFWHRTKGLIETGIPQKNLDQ